MEDDLILNFWGKDLSCEEDYVKASVEQYLRKDCGAGSNRTWCFILTFFLASCGATIFYVFTVQDGASRSRKGFKGWNVWRAILNLTLLDVPFFVIRCWCSYAFHIVASTLLIKNVVGVLHSSSLIYLLCCKGGDLTTFKKDNRLWYAFMKTLDDQFGAEFEGSISSEAECIQRVRQSDVDPLDELKQLSAEQLKVIDDALCKVQHELNEYGSKRATELFVVTT
jgi:hypothetical protein